MDTVLGASSSLPRLLAMFAPLFIAAAALAVGLVLRKFIDRFLDEDDPRRQSDRTGFALRRDLHRPRDVGAPAAPLLTPEPQRGLGEYLRRHALVGGLPRWKPG